jgi:hypothetical protein
MSSVVAEPLDLVRARCIALASAPQPLADGDQVAVRRLTCAVCHDQVRLSLDERILVKLRGDRDLRGRLHVRWRPALAADPLDGAQRSVCGS